MASNEFKMSLEKVMNRYGAILFSCTVLDISLFRPRLQEYLQGRGVVNGERVRQKVKNVMYCFCIINLYVLKRI